MKFDVFFLAKCLRTVSMIGIFSVVAGRSFSQNIELKIGPNALVAREPKGSMFIEPHLAADPKDPNRLLAASFLMDTGFNSKNMLAVFSSADGGKSWKRQNLPCIDCTDPWVSITNKGIVFISALGDHPKLPKMISQLMVYTSMDGGANWNEIPQGLGEYHDRSRSLAAPDGTLYIISGQSVLDGDKKSRNTVYLGKAEPGKTFVRAMSNIFPSNMGLNSDGLASLSDGSLLLTYDDGVRRMNGSFRSAGLLKGRRSWALVSKDRGQSFSMPLFLTEDCWRTPAFLAVDSSSGPYKDRLYYVCAGQNEREIILSYSADKGEEWSKALIEAPSAKDRSRLTPQVAVNKNGVVAVAWMDKREDTTGNSFAPYIAASIDGGKTFSKPVRVADAPSRPKYDQMGPTGRRWPTGGDYFGLTAVADGSFHLLWPDARGGSFELWSAAISVASPSKN
ncbi:MAG TPA: hypothetical protein VFR58_06680 [Flavisolibacter sp.]|nr:hypothetical protein [Flavisolibacter sp.]